MPLNLPNADDIKVWTIDDILKYMIEAGEETPFSVALIAEEFGISVQDANVRLFRLKTWGMVKVCKQSRPKAYRVTKWGRKYFDDLKNRKNKENGNN